MKAGRQADDIVLVSTSQSGLQTQLEILHTWLNTWMLNANMDKTKIVNFRPRNSQLTLAKLFLGSIFIEKVCSYDYLGLILTEFLDKGRIAEQLAKSTSRAGCKLTSVYFESKGLTWAVFSHLYDSLVCPVMDYGSAIWGLRHHVCDKVQRRMIRCFLGVGNKTPIPALEGDMGWFPSYIRHQIEAVRLWCDLCLLSTDRLTRNIFDWDYNLGLQRKSSWAGNVGVILCNAGLQDLNNLRVLTTSTKNIVDKVKVSLEKRFSDQWQSDVNNMAKLRTYKTLKSSFCVENYVKSLPPRSRSVIARLRCGVFPIRDWEMAWYAD